MRVDLAGRVAIVTGGGNGIGAATARALAAAGADVHAWDLAAGAGVVAVDVTDRAAVDAAVADVVAKSGRIDILINNAGIVRDAQLVKVRDGVVAGRMAEADFDAVIDVNVKGVFHCTQAVVPHMIERRWGRIVSASSIVGLYGNFGQTNYVAAKMGVLGMTKVWARELGRYGITANAVAPGFIETDMTRSMPPKILDGMLEHTPLRRLGQADEVANVYAFLASDLASYVSGAVISVDGGLVLGT